MKTAMQEWLDHLEEKEAFKVADKMKKHLLEREKQQVIKAYKAGEEKEPHTIISRIERDAEQYYNDTFNIGPMAEKKKNK